VTSITMISIDLCDRPIPVLSLLFSFVDHCTHFGVVVFFYLSSCTKMFH